MKVWKTKLGRMGKSGRRRLFPSYTPKFNGHRPASVSIAGRTWIAESWRDVLLKTCEFVRVRKSSEFQKILRLKGTKRPWFSRKSNELKDPVRIRGTDIFAETNVNANGLVLRSLQVLNLFGLEPNIGVNVEKRKHKK